MGESKFSGLGCGVVALGVTLFLGYALTALALKQGNQITQGPAPVVASEISAQEAAAPAPAQRATQSPGSPSISEDALVADLEKIGKFISRYVQKRFEDVDMRTSTCTSKSEVIRQINNITSPYVGAVHFTFDQVPLNIQGQIKVHFDFAKRDDGTWRWVMADKEATKYTFQGMPRTGTNPEQEFAISVHKSLIQDGYIRYVLDSGKEKNNSSGVNVTPSVNSEAILEGSRSGDGANASAKQKTLRMPAPTSVQAPVNAAGSTNSGTSRQPPLTMPEFSRDERVAASDKFDWLAARFKASFNFVVDKTIRESANDPDHKRKAEALNSYKSFMQNATISRKPLSQPINDMTADDCLMVIKGTGNWASYGMVLELQYRNHKWVVTSVIDGRVDADLFTANVFREAIRGAH